MQRHTASLAGSGAFAVGAAAALVSVTLGAGWARGLAAGAAAFATGLLLGSYRRQNAAVRQVEERLRDSERFTQALIQHSSDLIAILNPDGAVRYASPSHQRVMGYAPDELRGRNAFDLVHPDDRAALLEAFAEGLHAGEPASREFRFRHKDGSWRVVDAVAQAALDDPVIAGAVINSRDVTERRRAEDALRDSTRWLELLLSQMPAILWTVDRELRFTSAAGASLSRLGVARDAVVGLPMATVLGVDDPELVVLPAHRSALAGEPQDYELAWLGGYFLCHIEPLRDHAGEIVGVIGVAQDVTERRRAEGDKAALLAVAHDIAGTLELDDVLARVQQRTRALLPCDSVATLYWDEAGESFRLIAQVGLPAPLAAVVQAMTFARGAFSAAPAASDDVVVVNDVAARDEPLARLLDEHGVTAFAATVLVVRGRVVGVLAALMTGSERFHAPQTLLLQSIGRQLAVAIEAADLYAAQREEAAVAAALARIGQELISELNRPALLERLCQLTVEELGCDVSRTYLLDTERGEYVPVASFGNTPEEWEAVRVLRIPAALTDVHVRGFQYGEVVELDLGAGSGITDPLSSVDRAPRALTMALRRGGELVGLHAARYRNRADACTPAQERIARGIAHLASLALENARLVEELDRANHVKADFVAGMSHELRTPLNVIIGYSDLLADHIFGELAADQQETVCRIGEQGRELLELVNTTLDMSRLESGRVPLALEEVDLVNLLAEIELEVQLVRRNAALAVRWQVAPHLPPLRTDAMKLKVVIKNLLLNAIKFTDEGSVVVHAAARDGGVEIAVSDSGIGIAADMMARIFEPFRQGDHGGVRRGGVGLGLHIVRRLLEALGGTIEVESEPQRGSTFRVWVPSRREAERSGSAATAGMGESPTVDT